MNKRVRVEGKEGLQMEVNKDRMALVGGSVLDTCFRIK